MVYPLSYLQGAVPVHESTRTSAVITPDGQIARPPLGSMPRLSPHPRTYEADESPRLPVLSPHPPGSPSPMPSFDDDDAHPPAIRPPSPIQPPNFEDNDDEGNVAADIPYQAVQPVEEASIDDVTVGDVDVDQGVDEVAYKLAGTTEKGMPQLVDSIGYTYVVKIKRPTVTYWRWVNYSLWFSALEQKRVRGRIQGAFIYNHPKHGSIGVTNFTFCFVFMTCR